MNKELKEIAGNKIMNKELTKIENDLDLSKKLSQLICEEIPLDEMVWPLKSESYNRRKRVVDAIKLFVLPSRVKFNL